MRFAPHTDDDVRRMLGAIGLDSLDGLFEYQSMICDVTALEVSNASLYDGPTSLVEAVHMARAATRRHRVLVSALVDPRYVEVLEAFGRGAGLEIARFGAEDGRSAVP